MQTIKKLLLKIISNWLPLPPHLSPCVRVPQHGAKWLFFYHLPTLSGTIEAPGWSSRAGSSAADEGFSLQGPPNAPSRLLSWASRVRVGGQQGPYPRGAAGAHGGCSRTALPGLCWRGWGDGRIATPWSWFFSPLAVCREEPPRRDSRPGPSVPTGELPPRVDAGRTSSARFPPRKQNIPLERDRWHGADISERVVLTVFCSKELSHYRTRMLLTHLFCCF